MIYVIMHFCIYISCNYSLLTTLYTEYQCIVKTLEISAKKRLYSYIMYEFIQHSIFWDCSIFLIVCLIFVIMPSTFSEHEMRSYAIHFIHQKNEEEVNEEKNMKSKSHVSLWVCNFLSVADEDHPLTNSTLITNFTHMFQHCGEQVMTTSLLWKCFAYASSPCLVLLLCKATYYKTF